MQAWLSRSGRTQGLERMWGTLERSGEWEGDGEGKGTHEQQLLLLLCLVVLEEAAVQVPEYALHERDRHGAGVEDEAPEG